jgi:hypothetical protein
MDIDSSRRAGVILLNLTIVEFYFSQVIRWPSQLESEVELLYLLACCVSVLPHDSFYNKGGRSRQ